jgi:hypothetical protein
VLGDDVGDVVDVGPCGRSGGFFGFIEFEAGPEDRLRERSFRAALEMQCGVAPSELLKLVEDSGGQIVADSPPVVDLVVERGGRGCGSDVGPQSAPPERVEVLAVSEEVAVQCVG